MSRLDYSKWDHIDVSDDEDDTHPNIDTPSLFRWRHQARVEREQEHQQKKAQVMQQTSEHKKKMTEITKKLKEANVDETRSGEAKKLQVELKELKKQEEQFRKKEEELAKEERLTPWNVDSLSHPGFEKTVINKPKEKQKQETASAPEKPLNLAEFMDKHEAEIKSFGMLQGYDASQDYLRDHPELVCTETASYLTMWCINLAMEDKHALMERVAHQTIVMQYIMELSTQLKVDPRSCVRGLIQRLKSAEKQYIDAFQDELKGFISRVKKRAVVKIDEATRAAEEEEKKKRLGPGGLDPVEVMETLPIELKECFESRSVSKLQEVLAGMPKEEASYHMKRCVDSGLWVSDAKAAGLTPANEELRKMRGEELPEVEEEEEEEEEDEEKFYETVKDHEDREVDLGLD